MDVLDEPHVEDFAVDANSTTEAELLASVDTAGALKHVSDRGHIPHIKRAVEMVADIAPSAFGADDITDLPDALPAVNDQTGRLLH